MSDTQNTQDSVQGWGLVPFVSEPRRGSDHAYIEVIDTRTEKPITSIMSSFLPLQQANFDLLSHKLSKAVISLFRLRSCPPCSSLP